MITRLARFLLPFLLAGVCHAQHVVDPEFKPIVDQPTFTKTFPRVLFDEGHNNALTRMGRYKPFADLIELDGYQIVLGRKILNREALDTFKIYVIVDPLGAEDVDDQGAEKPAFADNECDAVREWVKAGGSLLLIADGPPFASAAEIMAKRFGVDFSKSNLREANNQETATAGWLTYSRENKLLGEHPIVAGRNESEKINRVVTYGGQSLKGGEGSSLFLKVAANQANAADNDNAADRAQAIAIKFGKGRVVVLGESAMLSAQVTLPERTPMGINSTNDNKQLALNIMHWLSGLLK